MKNIIIGTINTYQYFFSKELLGYRYSPCVFYPTCSEYAKSAVEKYGTLKGLYLSLKRVIRCHPRQRNTIDPLT